MKLLIGMLLLGIFASSQLSREANATELSDTVKTALLKNPRARIAYARIAKAHAVLSATRSSYYPDITFRGSQGVGQFEKSTTGNELEQDVRNLSLKATIPLFDPAVEHEERRDKQKVFSRIFASSKFLDELILDAVEAHADVFLNIELGLILAEELKYSESLLQKVEEKTEAGAGTKSDVSLVKSKINRLKAQISENQSNQLVSAARYEQVVGISPALIRFPEVPKTFLPTSVGEALARAGVNAPSIADKAFTFESDRAAIAVSKSAYLPSLDIELSVDSDHDDDGTKGLNVTYKALLVASWKLFGGFERHANILEKRAEAEESAADYDLELLEAKDRVKAFFAQIKQGIAQKEIALRNLENTEETLFSYEEEFEVGKKELPDLLDAASNKFTAERTYKFKEIDVAKLSFNLINNVGDLAAAFDTEYYKLPHDDINKTYKAFLGLDIFGNKDITREQSELDFNKYKAE